MAKNSKLPPIDIAKGRAPEEKTPSYVRSLRIENVRCFGSESQDLCFCDSDGVPNQWTILIGDNGTGKTTLLECLIGFEFIETKPPFESMGLTPRFTTWVFRRRDVHFARCGTDEWEMTLETEWGTTLSAKKRNPTTGICSVHRDGDLMMSDGSRAIAIPTFYSYGAARRMGATSLVEDSTDDATASLIDDSAELRNAEEWLLKLDYSASKPSEIRRSQRERFELVRFLLIDILPDVTDIRISAPTKQRPQPTAEFKTLDGWLPLDWVGYGYRTLIAWMVDFASRMVERYPRHKDPLKQPAVVLVDEIDLHLHPKWQRSLMTFLSKRFPNTQFIVTAHSPIFVQAATGANIVLLRRDEAKGHVVIENNPASIRGWRVDQLLTSDLFGLKTARPPDLEPSLIERKKLLSKSRLTSRDKTRLKQLEKEIGVLPDGETSDDARRNELLDRTLDALQRQLEGPV